MKIKYLLIASVCCLFACNQKGNQQQAHTDIPVMESLNKQSEPLSDPPAFDEVLIVPLETNDSILIGDIVDIQVYDSLILVSDMNNKLFVFNKDGKFKNFIGRLGQGPGQYLSIGTFCLDKFHNRILILDNMSFAFFSYEIDGTFKSKTDYRSNQEEAPRKMMMTDEKSILVYYALYKENIAYKLFDSANHNMIQTKAYQYVSSPSFIYSFSTHPMSVDNNGAVSLIMPLCDTIFQCIDTEFIPQYTVQHSNKMAPVVSLELNKKNNPVTLGLQYIKDGLFTGFTSILETKDKLLLNFGFYGDNSGYFIADKESMKGSYHVYSNLDNMNNSYSLDAESDEKILNMPFFKPLESNSDYFISYVMAYRLIALQENIEDSADSNLAKLKSTIDTLNEEDNPILIFYKLKNN